MFKLIGDSINITRGDTGMLQLEPALDVYTVPYPLGSFISSNFLSILECRRLKNA